MARATPIFDQVNVIAGDLPASIDFYRRLGVSMDPPPLHDGAPFHVNGESGGRQFDLDSPAFAQFWNQGWGGRDDLVGRVVLGFRVPSRDAVDDAYHELTGAGRRGLQPPFDAFWGARYAIVEDPNGIAVGLMSPIDLAKQHWPPSGWPP
jgi:catechol 2,3-dioxygenase-like lactoylglutathione lyase family enzyme